MSGSLGSVILQRLIKANLRVSCFHAPFFFFPPSVIWCLDCRKHPTPSPLSGTRATVSQRSHTLQGSSGYNTAVPLPSHFTSELTLPPFLVPFPVQGSPWQDAALHPAAVMAPVQEEELMSHHISHPVAAGTWLDCPLENAGARWKFPLGENSPKCTYPLDVTGQKQIEESVYVSKVCPCSNLTSGLVIPVVLSAIGYHCQHEDLLGQPRTAWLSTVRA